MLKDLMEHKRLDLHAPIISARRHAAVFSSAAPAPEDVVEAAKSSSLPFYKSELKSGPVTRPGVVPFVWESTPGHPKMFAPHRFAVCTVPDSQVQTEEFITFSSETEPSKRSESGAKKTGKLVREEKQPVYSKAPNTRSRAEFLSVYCSRSGLNGGPDVDEPSKRFFPDPVVREFLMDRFLHDAQAMATGSPESTSRKPPARAHYPKRSAERNGDVNSPPPNGKADALRNEDSRSVDRGSLPYSRALHCEVIRESRLRRNNTNGFPLPLKAADSETSDVRQSQILLPPPLPKSPSDSWLSRTLPSISSKNSSPQSLVTQFQPRTRDLHKSFKNLKSEMNEKPSKVHHHRISFAEVLTKPLSP